MRVYQRAKYGVQRDSRSQASPDVEDEDEERLAVAT